MANIITSLRIVLSMIMLFTPVFSSQFYWLYISAGITDMVDGTVARLTGSAGEKGAKLDSAADIIFTLVSLIKIIPAISLPGWCYVSVGGIALIKLSTLIRAGRMVSFHSVLNKLTGFVLFLFPLTVGRVDISISAAVITVIALAAALHEAYSVVHAENVVKI